MKTLTDYTRSIETDRAAWNFVKACSYRAAGVQFAEYPAALESYTKAAVEAASTGNSQSLRRQSSAFTSILSTREIFGQMAGVVPVPPYVNLTGLRSDEPEPQWVAGGNPVPVARMDFATVTTQPTSFAVIVGVSKELTKTTDERALRVLEAVIMRGIRRATNRLALATTAAVENEQPAGLLYGVAGIGSTSPASLLDDLTNLWVSVCDGDPLMPVYVTSPRAAQYLASLHVDGTPMFPNISPKTGGDIQGVPVVLTRAAAEKLILIDASDVALTDEGLLVERSENAAVKMDSNPTSPATMVSGFQTGTVFLKAIRFLHWRLINADAIEYLTLPIGGSPR